MKILPFRPKTNQKLPLIVQMQIEEPYRLLIARDAHANGTSIDDHASFMFEDYLMEYYADETGIDLKDTRQLALDFPLEDYG